MSFQTLLKISPASNPPTMRVRAMLLSGGDLDLLDR
jgi:hypothetical protein